MNQNFQKELDKTIEKLQQTEYVPTLFLHSCCAPCSSYVLEYLSEYFRITVFYYNPNIYPDEEYYKRVREQKDFIAKFPAKHPIDFVEGSFDKETFYEMAKGMEDVPEGAAINEAVELAKKYDTEQASSFINGVLGGVVRGQAEVPEETAE